MAKFAKLFQNPGNEQLLLTVVSDEDNGKVCSAVRFTFEQSDCYVDVKISPLTRENALQIVDQFPQELAEEILEDPIDFFTSAKQQKVFLKR